MTKRIADSVAILAHERLQQKDILKLMKDCLFVDFSILRDPWVRDRNGYECLRDGCMILCVAATRGSRSAQSKIMPILKGRI